MQQQHVKWHPRKQKQRPSTTCSRRSSNTKLETRLS